MECVWIYRVKYDLIIACVFWYFSVVRTVTITSCEQLTSLNLFASVFNVKTDKLICSSSCEALGVSSRR